MADRNAQDQLLHEAFGSYAAAVAFVPPGADTVRASVRRRRLVRAAAVGAVVVAVLIGSAAAVVWTDPRLSGPPVDTGTPTPSIGASPTPSAASALAPVTDGDVRDATLAVTPLVPTCPAARVDFHGGVGPAGSVPDQVGAWRIYKVVPANLDGDAADEAAVLVDCQMGEREGYEVIAVERDAAGGVATLGTVVTTMDGGVEEIFDIARAGPAGVRVEVGNVHSCCVDVPERLQRQWRVYGWDGGRYAQIAGPTAFPANPRLADLTLTAKPLVFGPVVLTPTGADGWHYGTLAITVRNNAPVRSAAQLISLTLQDSILPSTGGWGACQEFDRTSGTWCRHGALEPGASYTLRLKFRIHQGFPIQRGAQAVEVTTPSTRGADIPDTDMGDNRVNIEIQLG